MELDSNVHSTLGVVVKMTITPQNAMECEFLSALRECLRDYDSMHLIAATAISIAKKLPKAKS